MNEKVTEVFNTGTEAFYKVRIDYSHLIEKWAKEDELLLATELDNAEQYWGA